MRRPTLSETAAVLGLSTLLLTPYGHAQAPFDVRIELPAEGTDLSAQLSGGWPLVIRVQPTLPADTYVIDYEGSMAVVAFDPSACFAQYSGDDDQLQTCLQASPGTVYTSFAIDDDRAGVPESASDMGDSRLRSLLVDSVDGGPVFRPRKSSTPVRLGVTTGGEVLDGIGYGANDDWPGLVLLSDHGVGIVLDSGFDPLRRATRRNLAGMLTWTAYELLDASRKSSISTGATVPAGLFLPLMLIDVAVGAPSLDTSGQTIYTQPAKYRIDGGPVLDGPNPCASNYAAGLLRETYELRAFLVQGSAPAQLVDEDRDGDVDALDAELAGLTVISTEARLRFRQWLGESGEYLRGPVHYAADLDRNGSVTNALCDGDNDLGPGRIKTPPQ